jgi:hypothetical protein
MLLAGMTEGSLQTSKFGNQDIDNSVMQDDSTLKAVKASDIITKIRANEPVDYDNILIVDDMDLRQIEGQINQAIKITNSRFQKDANFAGSEFGESLDFEATTFEGNTSFKNAKFLGITNFVGTKFNGDVDFRVAEFSELANFVNTQFIKESSFATAKFNGDTIFMNANFTKDVAFDFTEFSRLASFMNARFFDDASFANAQFKGTANFANSTFEVNSNFAGARFNRQVVFKAAKFSGDAIFGLSSFSEFADFSDVDFDEVAFFALTNFAGIVHFESTKFDKDLILENARIYSIELDNAAFSNESMIALKDADFTKFKVKWEIIKNRLKYDGSTYLALVKNYKNLEWFKDADDCYYQYKRISQAEKSLGLSKFVDVIAWLSCGYGVRPSYTIYSGFWLIVFFGAAFWKGNAIRKSSRGSKHPFGRNTARKTSLIDAIFYSALVFLTYAPPDWKYSGRWRYAVLMEGTIGWLIMALFLVTLSNVVIR